MIRDSNKKIIGITYNHLNLPVTITFDIPGTNSISYVYDATGVKKSKLAIVDGVIEPKTDYISGFQYVFGNLQFFPTAEGYVKKPGNIIIMYLPIRITWGIPG